MGIEINWAFEAEPSTSAERVPLVARWLERNQSFWLSSVQSPFHSETSKLSEKTSISAGGGGGGGGGAGSVSSLSEASTQPGSMGKSMRESPSLSSPSEHWAGGGGGGGGPAVQASACGALIK